LLNSTAGNFWRINGKRTSVANAQPSVHREIDCVSADLSAIITNVGGTIGGDKITLPTNLFEEEAGVCRPEH